MNMERGGGEKADISPKNGMIKRVMLELLNIPMAADMN
jgi:hypothetical protein